MKIMLVLALMGFFAMNNGGNDAVDIETPSYDSVVYADYFEEYPEEAAKLYPEAYATYLEEKDDVEAMLELYEQAEQQNCASYDYEITVDDNAWSDTHQTAPMTETEFANEALLGYWMDYSDAEQPRVMCFFEENGQLMYSYYTITAGNDIGMNIANETTNWVYSNGIVNTMPNQGAVYCQCGTDERVYVSFYYGFDGTDVMYDQEDGTAYYKVQ